MMFQSTRPVRGATDIEIVAIPKPYVSIHAPRAGRDRDRQRNPPKRGWVSIHAPRAGRDIIDEIGSGAFLSFNPRAPCGARPYGCNNMDVIIMFQSTRPVRGATLTTVR